jgi:hypothetical protein
VAASAALFGTYLLITYLPNLSLQTFLDCYFLLLGSIAISGAATPVLKRFTSGAPPTFGGNVTRKHWRLSTGKGHICHLHGGQLD